MRRLLTLVVSLGLFVLLAVPVSAGSAPPGTPPPTPTCFVGPCTETDHFSEVIFFGSPLPCPGLNEWALVDSTGNGVQHITVNAAQDFWVTTTLAGPASIQLILVITFKTVLNPPNPPMLVPDTWTNDGLPITGHLQQWFGVQGNRNNFSQSFTTNFSGTNPNTGQPVSFHLSAHANTTGPSGSTPPFTFNPSSMHFNATCG